MTTVGETSVGKRLGLVLAGGGAKGAYQFGALKRLAEEGLHFSAVSGTSVGGLNGAIWATGNLARGEQIWMNLRQDQFLPWRAPFPFSLVTGMILATWHALFHYRKGTVSLPDSRFRKPLVRLNAAIGIILFVFFVPHIFGSSHPPLWLLLSAIACFATFAILINQQGLLFGAIKRSFWMIAALLYFGSALFVPIAMVERGASLLHIFLSISRLFSPFWS